MQDLADGLVSSGAQGGSTGEGVEGTAESCSVPLKGREGDGSSKAGREGNSKEDVQETTEDKMEGGSSS